MENLTMDNVHNEYQDREDDWLDMTYVIDGERVMKSKGTRFVPKLDDQKDEEYFTYISRGSFYGATSRTVSGFTGAIMRKPPIIEVSERMNPFLQQSTQQGLTFDAVIRNTVYNLLAYGRYGIYCDYSQETKMPFLSEYDALSILNWNTSIIDGQLKLTYLTLKETAYIPSNDALYSFEPVERVRQLYLDEHGYLVTQLWEKKLIVLDSKTGSSEEAWVRVDVVPGKLTAYPNINGKRLNYIPFVCFGPNANTMNVDKPPLLDLMFLNIAHWRTDVDYRSGLHYCALPTIYLLGFQEGKKIAVGPGKSIRNKDSNAKVGMLEFTGQGMGAISNEMENMERKMAVLGARLLEEQKKAAEAAETLKIRTSGETATLVDITQSISQGMVKVLEYCSNWLMIKDQQASVEMNSDFIDKSMSPQMISELLKTLQAGEISQDTFLYSLKEGEVLPDNRTIEEEKELIESDADTRFKEQEETILPDEEDVPEDILNEEE